MVDNVPITGQTLRLLRQTVGLRLADVAELTGLSPSYLCEIERGRKRVTPSVEQAIIKLYTKTKKESA